MAGVVPGSCLEWLLAFPGCPSIEGRDQSSASNSEKRRQLQNRAWTITGFKTLNRRCTPMGFLVEDLEPVPYIKPGPDDPMPDLVAEATLCKGAKRQTSLFYDEARAKTFYHSLEERDQKKYDQMERDGRKVMDDAREALQRP